MDKNTLEKLFTYYRLKTIRGESGAGIGLIISREFLDKNNASVSVTSEIDKGTRFVISI